jgi:hypothetical protein
MKTRKHFFFLLLAIFFTSLAFHPNDWGFVAHRKINQMAVYTLPPELIVFYKKHIEYVEKHAVDPDKRRYASKDEAPRHYIDLDHYGTLPFDNVPRRWIDALAKFTEVFVVNSSNDTLQLFGHLVVDFSGDTLILKSPAIQTLFQQDSIYLSKKRYLAFVKNNIDNQFYESEWKLSLENLDTLFQTQIFQAHYSNGYAENYLSKYGIVPWHLEKMLYQLTYAFKEKDLDKILHYSSDIGHYIGDAHVPLHTTMNYNGQMTGQDGIHGFWESRLPELYADKYNFMVGKAKYIKDPNSYFWDIVLESHQLLDSVLLIEKDLTDQFASDQKYCFETLGEQTARTYCEAFAKAYHDRLNGMVEKRMRDSIKAVGDVWLTAWVNAGQPDLSDLEEENKKKSKRK